MSNIEIAGVIKRKSFLAAPERNGDINPGRAGAIIALTTHKTPRLFIHAMRHRYFDKFDKTAAAIEARKSINTDHWVEIGLSAYVLRGAVVTLEGQIVRSGAIEHTGDDAIDDTVEADPAEELARNVRELKNGWTLL